MKVSYAWSTKRMTGVFKRIGDRFGLIGGAFGPFGLKWVKKMQILFVYFSNGLFRVDDDNWRVDLMHAGMFGVLHI